ncbi:MAG: flagellar biosynthesis protein FlgB [Acidobacteria bacterium]|nr:flagellar biosynthesis protein FlgB [Acidobacteriota bacterium]
MRIDQAALDRFLNQLEHALDTMSRRQSVVASNVANIDTPGYRTRDMDFDKALAAAMDGRADGVAARARELRGLPVRNDGNNVNLDREMMALGEIRGRYEAATTLLRYRLRQLRSAISDGRVV